MIRAFKDSADGYYQAEVDSADDVPTWAAGMAPCPIQTPTAVELTPLEKLAKLDAENQLTQRNLREFIMLTAEALKSGTPIDITVLPGVQNVYAVETTAITLRAQL